MIRVTVEARQGIVLSRFRARVRIEAYYSQIRRRKTAIKTRTLHFQQKRKLITNYRGNLRDPSMREGMNRQDGQLQIYTIIKVHDSL